MQPLLTELTRTLAVAGVLVAAGASTARADSDERVAAIRALYGEGLSIQISGETISIDWGTLDAATYRRYQTAYYLPALESISANLYHGSAAFPGGDDVSTSAAARTLIEPILKHTLCRTLASSISDFKGTADAENYCSRKALEHARSPTVAFRGAKVSYTSVKTFDGARLDEPLGGDTVLITVAAPGALDHFGAWNPVPQLVSDIRGDAPKSLEQLGRDTRGWADKLSASAKSRIAKRDKRLHKSRGAVVFTESPVAGWEPIEPVAKKAKPSCDSAQAHIYGPKAGGHYDLTVRANTVLCTNSVQSKGFIKHSSIAKMCGEQLTSGDNEIEVSISKNITKDTGRRRIYVKKDRIEGRKLYSNERGKRLVTASITCTR